ncbi:MAG: sarcosine oxidase subunit gamma [Alphaproteobacteria bacterium]
MSDLTAPLAHRDALKAPGAAAVNISAISERAMIDLRVGPNDGAGRKAFEKALGLELPTSPRTSTAAGGITALWLSIDQWLLVVPAAQRETHRATLEKVAQRRFAVVTDLSDARAIIRLEGIGAPEIIMKGASADLTQAPQGTVRRMNFAGIAAMVHVVETSPPVLDFYVGRSFGDYAWEWLAQAARPGAALQLFGAQPTPAV